MPNLMKYDLKFNLTQSSFWALLLCFILLESSLFALNEVLDNPSRYENQRVEVRGFLYQSMAGDLLLRAESGLKSCCVNTGIRADKQIVIKSQDRIPLSTNVIALQGTFKMERTHDQQGRVILTYVLEDAHVVEKSFPFLLVCGVGVICMLAAGYFFYFRKN